ncbi:MAG TPA: NAD(+) synthase [Humisphaera sp.]|jgi:NAD+ synthase (glutamine-hydrolysing)|nr:NAD(+) synthase [Humisphaera sp.]
MTSSPRPFDSLYRHGFARVSVCVPKVKVAAPAFNAEQTLALARAAHDDHAALALFPELGLSAYSNEDLFHQDALLDATEAALDKIVQASNRLTPVLLVGAPLRLDSKLFNCAIVIHHGRVLGVVPKSYLPNYREFYEKRQFTAGFNAPWNEARVLGQQVPFGTDLIFEASDLPGFNLFAEICEDVWTPIPPSTWGALAGATVLANLSASNIVIGKAAYRRALCAGQSGKCVAAYLYTAAGLGESTTDLAWDGHALIYENANLLAESERFCDREQRITADIDLDRLRQERMRLGTFNDAVGQYRDRLASLRRIRFELGMSNEAVPLRRIVERFPYVPHDPQQWDERCFETYNIQVNGLEQRLRASSIKKVVIGISGGLDSTQALIVCCRTMDRIGLPRGNVLAFTMPGFATSDKTKANAWRLMKALDVTAAEIDIRPSCLQMLKDIGHPFSRGEPVHDLTFENVQAGERTSHLFRLANLHGGIVVGTGDLSELALGWNTYGVGDQMSHYNVNASVPKTLVQHLIRWQTQRAEVSAEARAVLGEVLSTEISPELIPADADGASQKSEQTVGPYELQDFHLYYITRYGYLPSKVAFLAHHAWADAKAGHWPPGYPQADRRQYELPVIKKWLRVFLQRFFGTSQFKRSAMPNGPKVGSGGSLSPRSDWRAPSDSGPEVWVEELERNVP